MTNFSAVNRPFRQRQLTEDIYDLFVIGGGITGAGIALDAATRGLKVALAEIHASRKTAAVLKYIVLIQGQQKNLFKEKDRWYVEASS